MASSLPGGPEVSGNTVIKRVYFSPAAMSSVQTLTLTFTATSNTTVITMNYGYIIDNINVNLLMGNVTIKEN